MMPLASAAPSGPRRKSSADPIQRTLPIQAKCLQPEQTRAAGISSTPHLTSADIESDLLWSHPNSGALTTRKEKENAQLPGTDLQLPGTDQHQQYMQVQIQVQQRPAQLQLLRKQQKSRESRANSSEQMFVWRNDVQYMCKAWGDIWSI